MASSTKTVEGIGNPGALHYVLPNAHAIIEELAHDAKFEHDEICGELGERCPICWINNFDALDLVDDYGEALDGTTP